MKNKFGATCTKCGNYVEPGKGETHLHSNGWRTYHSTTDGCKAASPVVKRTQSAGNFGGYRGGHSFYDYYEDDDFYHDGTSEDVNPNEGSK